MGFIGRALLRLDLSHEYTDTACCIQKDTKKGLKKKDGCGLFDFVVF